MDSCLGEFSWLYDEGVSREHAPKQDLDKGITAIPFQHNGKRMWVVVDDFLPCLENAPMYCNARSRSIWFMMIEKAYAKLMGGYMQIMEHPYGMA